MAGNRHADLNREVTRSLGSALDQLQQVWDEIGLDSSQRRDRLKVVVIHINQLFGEMVAEEQQLRDRVLENIKTYGKDLLVLTKELGLSPYEPPEGLTNVQLEKSLRNKVQSLEYERRERLKRLQKLKREDQHLCDIICATPYYIATGAVPTTTQLSELEEHVKKLTAEKDRRHKIFTSTKSTILQMLDELEQCPNNSFEREICEEEDSFLLTSENMSALKDYHDRLEKKQQENFARASRLREHMETLWERLSLPSDERQKFMAENTGFKPLVIEALKSEVSRCELLKLKNMKQVIESTRRELETWWDKCYYTQSQRDEFKPFFDEDYTEDLLDLHDNEVRDLKAYHDENKHLLELVEQRQTLWTQFLEHERKAADPSRLFNTRNCNLLKEEKARKKVSKDLPKVEEDVKQKIAEWEASTGKFFMISGMRFVDFITQTWRDYEQSKENEKVQRHQAKSKLLEEELMYGSRPAATTPGKKRTLGTTLSRTPNKKFKNNETAKTPNAHTPGFNRTGRSNYTSVYSPICMAPRSANKTKQPLLPPPCNIPRNRRVLAEQNNTDALFSETTVSAQQSKAANSTGNKSDDTLASTNSYDDFARGINPDSRPNCRSSILPQNPPKAAYF